MKRARAMTRAHVVHSRSFTHPTQPFSAPFYFTSRDHYVDLRPRLA